MTFVRYWLSHFKGPLHARSMANVHRAFVEDGHKVHLVCSAPPADDAWLTPLRELGIALHYQPRQKRNFDLGCIRRARKLLRSLGADAMACDNMHTSPLLGATLAGVPVRLWFKRSMETASEQCRAATFRERHAPSLRLSCRLATRTVAVSSAVRDELADMGVSTQRVIVMHNPVEIIGKLGDRATARAALGYADNEVMFATVGHAVEVKGWDVLLRAFAQVHKANGRARLMLIGSCVADHERQTYEQLQTIINEFGLAHAVRFTGHVADVWSPLSAADVFVLSSRSEGYSLALIEAMSAGLACISSRVGVAPDVIRHGVNGLLAGRNDVASLSAAMKALADAPDLRRRLAETASSAPLAPTFRQYSQELLELCTGAGGTRRCISTSSTKVVHDWESDEFKA